MFSRFVLAAMFLVIGTVRAFADVQVTFLQQDGPAPSQIEIASISGDFFDQISFPGQQVITIPNDAFAKPLEEFYVDFTYDNGETVTIDIVVALPKKGVSKKVIYLYRPRPADNYSDETKRWHGVLQRTRGRKAFGPYFICRQNYFTASAKEDLSSKLRAGVCWFDAAVTLVFADHPRTREFFLPDLVANGFLEEVIGVIDNGSSSGQTKWDDVAESIKLSEAKIAELKQQLKRMKFSNWRFFSRLSRLGNGSEEDVCDLYESYRNLFAGLSDDDRQFVIAEFKLSDKQVSALDGSNALQVSLASCGIAT